MYFDKTLMFLDEGAFNATPAILNLNVPKPVKGQQMRVHLSGTGITGMTAVVVKSGATSATATTTVATFPALAATVEADGFSFYLPIETEQYVTIALTGITAGVITAGIVFDTQTAQ